MRGPVVWLNIWVWQEPLTHSFSKFFRCRHALLLLVIGQLGAY
jgi:hypothetical protein